MTHGINWEYFSTFKITNPQFSVLKKDTHSLFSLPLSLYRNKEFLLAEMSMSMGLMQSTLNWEGKGDPEPSLQHPGLYLGFSREKISTSGERQLESSKLRGVLTSLREKKRWTTVENLHAFLCSFHGCPLLDYCPTPGVEAAGKADIAKWKVLPRGHRAHKNAGGMVPALRELIG